MLIAHWLLNNRKACEFRIHLKETAYLRIQLGSEISSWISEKSTPRGRCNNNFAPYLLLHHYDEYMFRIEPNFIHTFFTLAVKFQLKTAIFSMKKMLWQEFLCFFHNFLGSNLSIKSIARAVNRTVESGYSTDDVKENNEKYNFFTYHDWNINCFFPIN